MNTLYPARGIFKTHFPKSPDPSIFLSPGRVNLIGEHTDYNNGFVLPFAIEFNTRLALSLRTDDRVRVYSKTLDQYVEFRLNDEFSRASPQWFYYIAGVFQLLIKQGYKLCGADMVVEGTLPIGAGLSSSASLTTATAFGVLSLHHYPTDLIQLAKLCQSVEHQYMGTQCGIMDPLICALGKTNHALLIDCHTLALKLIPFNLANDVSLLVCESGVKHELANSEYNSRRHECETAAKIMKVENLRGVDLSLLNTHRSNLSLKIYRRCHHVLTENDRTLKATQAMKCQDWKTLGSLMTASHRSLQYDYEVSCPELDFLVDTAHAHPGVLGARMTGGGFGGCTINLVNSSCKEQFKEAISNCYQAEFGHHPNIFSLTPQDGVKKST